MHPNPTPDTPAQASHPHPSIPQYRPTSSLFSPTTVASILGLMVISLLYLVGALVHGTNHPDYVQWPSKMA